ncbi:MAG: FYDLN acid domain-containing protein [Alphaproteobacteria bacterium]|nr:FYDLN acid domain-containing protein [Alphaproteobacteria bacterium]
MAKPEWGIKRTCQSCDAFFYDMKKNPITCPKCLSVYDEKALLSKKINYENTRDDSFKDLINADIDNGDGDFYLDVHTDLLDSLDELESDIQINSSHNS